jgi:hypothetical protein
VFKKTKPKPVIKVLAVKEEKRDVITTESERYYGAGNQSKETKVKSSFTIVLFTKDGALMTREFNGAWDLTDIKKWEDE